MSSWKPKKKTFRNWATNFEFELIYIFPLGSVTFQNIFWSNFKAVSYFRILRALDIWHEQRLVKMFYLLYISTSVWSAQHPNAGRNIQHLSILQIALLVFIESFVVTQRKSNQMMWDRMWGWDLYGPPHTCKPPLKGEEYCK